LRNHSQNVPDDEAELPDDKVPDDKVPDDKVPDDEVPDEVEIPEDEPDPDPEILDSVHEKEGEVMGFEFGLGVGERMS
jgi:hypothetical protein